MARYYICFLVYLFAYFQASPAVEFAAAKQLEDNLLESTDSQLVQRDTLHRQKRFIPFLITVVAGLISGIGAAVIGNEINKAIDRSGQGSSNANDKPVIINNIINNNINQAQALKEKVTRVDPNAGRAIHVGGFNCDHSFCRRVGDGQASMGICSPYICHCSNGNPHPQQCGVGTVFDPLYRVCNWPANVRVCG
ncbi:hypothetical protein CBL_02479 [Carabus blaptoides fortunei]